MNPIFFIQRTGDLHAVRSVSQDHHHLEYPVIHPTDRVLRGEAATALYAALTGHRYGHSPANAHPSIARAWRAHIAAVPTPNFQLAHRVLQQFGPFIQPWLGLVKVGPNGKIITNDPDYTRRISL